MWSAQHTVVPPAQRANPVVSMSLPGTQEPQGLPKSRTGAAAPMRAAGLTWAGRQTPGKAPRLGPAARRDRRTRRLRGTAGLCSSPLSWSSALEERVGRKRRTRTCRVAQGRWPANDTSFNGPLPHRLTVPLTASWTAAGILPFCPGFVVLLVGLLRAQMHTFPPSVLTSLESTWLLHATPKRPS